MLTLTVAEIKCLAEFVGLTLDARYPLDTDDLDAQVTITECPEVGVLENDFKVLHYAHIAHFNDCPGDGVFPLGDAVAPPPTSTMDLVITSNTYPKCSKSGEDHEFVAPAPYCPSQQERIEI